MNAIEATIPLGCEEVAEGREMSLLVAKDES